MAIQFLRGNPQTPKGHAILVARGMGFAGATYCTYCVVPPIPMSSIAKFIPPFLAAQLPAEQLQDTEVSAEGMPIPPILEEVDNFEYIKALAEHRDDDLCDIGSISSRDDMTRMQMAIAGSQEYTSLYMDFIARVQPEKAEPVSEPLTLNEIDPEELFFQTMPDRQKLAELGKLIGTARYAIEGHDSALLQDTRRKMQRIVHLLADKYRGSDLVAAAIDPDERGAKLAELYLKRAYKLLDEEYADIPAIERSIRELKEQA